jgi:hypothetical protein
MALVFSQFIPEQFPEIALSMDSKRGAELYKFDMSLMERLATAGLPMSRIDVQRRMRPTISSLIRFVHLSHNHTLPNFLHILTGIHCIQA